jgi:tRNA threonylcarbamoyl adenosine modification protein (Sua5/YciO/YrdC/YwlC family)
MLEVKINLKNFDQKNISLIANAFKSGETIAYPTDTIYGLGCIADDLKAIKKICKIKRRRPGKPLIILASSKAMAQKYARTSRKENKLLSPYWPGPVTVILKSRGRLPKILEGGSGKIAIRVPKNPFLIKLIRKIGVPIVSTSLNISRRPPPSCLADLEKYFGKQHPDLFVDTGKLPRRRASKIIDLTQEKPFVIRN